MKKNVFTGAVIITLCAALSVCAVFVKRYRTQQLKEEVKAAILADTGSTELDAARADNYPMYVVTGDDFVTMRLTASDEAEEVNRIYPGSIVEFMGDAADGYAYIRGKGSTTSGYVKKEFLEKSDFIYSLSDINIVDTDSSVYSYEEMENDMSLLDEKYSAFSYSSIGKSADGRDIYKISVGNAPKKVLLYGTLAGTDYMTAQLLMKQAEYYAHYTDNGVFRGYKYSDLLENVSFDIVPMPNPDGVCINQWGADILISENLRDTVKNTFYTDRSYGYTDAVKTTYYSTWRANANGVDINRNFPVGFDSAPVLKGISHSGFKGTSSLSEPESKALCSLIDNGGYSAVIGYTAEGGCVTYIGDIENNNINKKMHKFASDISEFTHYPLSGDNTSYSRCGSALLYSAEKGIPAVEIGISRNSAPLSIDDLQEPWIKLRELPAFLAQLFI